MSGLVEAARFERDRRGESYPQKIFDGKIAAEAAAVDYQCWVAIAEWIETERFASFAGAADPESPDAPIIRWPDLELAAEGALLSVNGKIHRMEADPDQEKVEPDKRISPMLYAEKLGALRQRRSCLWTIHRKVQLRRQSIDTINAEFRKRKAA